MVEGQSDRGFVREDGKRRVLVEMRAPAEADFSAAEAPAAGDLPQIEIDRDYEPVAVPPPPSRAADIESRAEQTVIVRAFVSDEEREELEASDAVVAVYDDVRVQPFCGDVAGTVAYGGRKAPDQRLEATDAPCPIPPCDCEPEIAKGDLADAARHLRAHDVWQKGFRGRDIVVGIVDGGIMARGRVAGGEIGRVIGGWPTADWGTKDYWDSHGHMCATDVLGMAPEAHLYDIRIADGNDAFLSVTLAAFGWAIRQRRINGTPHVLSNSWGLYDERWEPGYARNPDHPFTRKVVEAIELGIHVLFAAGNCGGTCPSWSCGSSGPGKSIWGANGHPRVMTVGAVNTRDQLIGYSSEGPAALSDHKPDFCATSHVKGYFDSDTGTSAACPMAAGVVALLKQAQPTLTPGHALEVLKRTARNIGEPGWDQHSGSGVIDAGAALKEILPEDAERERELRILRSVVRSARSNPRYAQCLAFEVCGYGTEPPAPDSWLARAARVNAILDAQPRYRGVTCRELRRAAICGARRERLMPIVRLARRKAKLRRCLCYELCGRGSAIRATGAQRRIIARVRAELDRCPWTKSWFCIAINCPTAIGLQATLADDLLEVEVEVEPEPGLEQELPLASLSAQEGIESTEPMIAADELGLWEAEGEGDLVELGGESVESLEGELDLVAEEFELADSDGFEATVERHAGKIVTTIYFPTE